MTTHDWDNLDGEALETALGEAMGLPLASELGNGWFWSDPKPPRNAFPAHELLTFENLTGIVWERYLKQGSYTLVVTASGAIASTSSPSCGESRGPTPEIALARAFGKALEAGE